MEISEVSLYHQLGERVKQQRKQRSLTQSQLATATGMLRTTIANIEGGRQKASLHVLYTLSIALGVDVCTLLPRVAEIVHADEEETQAPIATEFLKQLMEE